MNKAAPWNIKGVDFDTRDAAREAAEREGMSLGEWLNDAIAQRAADLGADPEDIDDDERQSAVSARIARMRGGAKRRNDRRPSANDDDEERGRGPRRLSRGARDREISWRDSGGTESMLDEAIEAIEARFSRSQQKTQRTLAEVADYVQSARTRGARDTHLLKSIARRLADIEDRVAPDSDAAGPVREKVARLESGARRSEDPSALRDLDSRLSQIAEQLDRSSPGRGPDGERLARIENRLAALADKIDTGPAAPAAAERRPLVDAVAQIAQRQRELDGGSFFPPRRGEARPPFDARRAPSELDARLTGLQGDIARMSAHIEKMREEATGRAAASDPSLDKLRSEVAAVSRGLGDLAPRTSVSAIERTVRDMADRLEAMRQDAGRNLAAAPVEQIARELRAGMRELDPRPAIGALESDMRAISDKLESLEKRGGVDPNTVRAIYDQTREVRDLLARAATASLPGERAQRELADIAQRLEHNAGVGVAAGDVARIVADIRDVVAQGASGEAFRALERRIELLSERIDSALASASGGAEIAAFGDRLDKLHRAVAQSLAAPRQHTPADTGRLEEMVRDLAVKVDRASDPHAGRDDLIALQHQIENLSHKIERSNGRDENVASLERMIGDLFSQLTETREAAENAARSAVRDALANAPAAGSGELGRELADLRQIQDASDQRTHATLKAVHETLEKVVDRLATLEDDISDRRPQVREARDPGFEPPAASAAAPKVAGSSTTAAAALARKKGPPPVEQPRGGRAEPPASREPDILIEPGAGRTRRPSAAAPAAAIDDIGEKNAQASFIAAARRAALAAQAASAAAEEEEELAAAEGGSSKFGGALAQAKSVFERRRKPILLSLAALIGLLGALQIARVYLDAAPPGPPEPLPIVRPAAPAAKNDGAKAPGPEAARKAPVAAPDLASAEPPASARPDAASKAPVAGFDQAPPMLATPPGAAPRKVEAAPPATVADAPSEARKVDPAPVGAIAKKAEEPAVMAAIEAAAARGDAVAQYELGARRADGNQTSRDLKGAADMFEKSATKGFAPAQYRLGVVYERGLGVPRDTALAKLWYQRAADRGNVRSMHNLAVLVADGDGKPDYAAAAKWFRRAAEHGVRDSQYNLAILYARGMGGPQDLAQSYAWFSAAAVQGDEDAGKKRDEIGARLDSAALTRARGMASTFRPRTVDPAVNEVAPPPGGWQALQPPKNEEKAAAKPKISRM
jgi:localization factor PodJL